MTSQFNDEKPGISCGDIHAALMQAARRLTGNMKQLKKCVIVMSSFWSIPIDSKAVKFRY